MIKVILVEDEDLIRQGMKLAIPWDQFGCAVIGEAWNGESGIEIIERLQPDIVFTDIRMPKMDGLEMIKALQGRCHAQFIILSGYDEFSYAKEAINLGAAGYLLKPIDDDDFAQVLQKAVDRYQNEKSSRDTVGELSVPCPLQEGSKDKYIIKACKIMKDRLQEDLTLKMIADELYISESYLGKLFKSQTNYTFLDMLTFYRMRAAVNYLEQTDLKIYEISYRVGYNDSKYFSKTFQKIVGVKPKEYREGYQLSCNHILNQLNDLE